MCLPCKQLLSYTEQTQFTTNNGYVYEVAAHWISSYFLGDTFLQLPPTPEDAIVWTDRNAAWLRKRYPGAFTYANESYSGDLAFWRYVLHVTVVCG